jgi:hypothetical protein
MPMAATIPPLLTITNTGGPTAIVITPVDATCGNANGSVTLGAVTGGVLLLILIPSMDQDLLPPLFTITWLQPHIMSS